MVVAERAFTESVRAQIILRQEILKAPVRPPLAQKPARILELRALRHRGRSRCGCLLGVPRHPKL
jgi:hypothetical protein